MTTGPTTRQLGDLGTVVRGVSYNPTTDLMASRTAETVDLLRANNVQDGSIVLDDVQHVHCRRVRPDQILRAGDLLICAANGSKRLVGKSAQVRPGAGGGDTFGAFMMTYRPDSRLVDPGFIAYEFQTKKYRDWVGLLLAGSSINNLRPSAIAEYSVSVPGRSEQRRIASVLAETDDLIDALERLIAKKRSIKQGIMQQLLSGKTRLPGFSEPWREARLGDITRIKTGTRNNQDKQSSGYFPFFVRSATVERINSYSYDCEAILVPGEGGIGSIFHYIDGKFEVHQRVYKISDFVGDVSGKFVYHYMRQFFGAHAMENSVKATVDSLRLPTFSAFEMTIPTQVDEQRAIVAVLDDAENEIAALKYRLVKAQQVKQGMMQELLTGRTHLGVEGDAA